MGRSKQYERTELLDRAVELFRRHGFNGTSTAALVAELGRTLGMTPDAECTAGDLLAEFDPSRIPTHAWAAAGPGLALSPLG